MKITLKEISGTKFKSINGAFVVTKTLYILKLMSKNYNFCFDIAFCLILVPVIGLLNYAVEKS